MKLLMLIHRLPFPPDRGVKLRAARELNWLSRQHQVWVAGFAETGGNAMPAAQGELCDHSGASTSAACVAGIRDVCAVPLRRSVAAWNAGCSMLAGRTATEGYFGSQALSRRVMEWAEAVDFDAVLAFSSSMAPLALRVPARRHVLDMVDVDSRKWLDSAEQARGPMKRVYRTEGRRLGRRELEWIDAFDATVLVSERERELLRPAASDRVHVLTIEAGSESATTAAAGPALPEEPTVGFLGAMDYGPNVDAACWFAESIWPRVRMRRPDANWWIVGRSPRPVVQRLAGTAGIHVTGTVPAVEPYLDRIRVNVAPLRLARGLQNKVLAAMAAGRPCVVTSCVAQGLGVRHREHVLVADSSESFADAVLELLTDRSKAESIANSGREFVAREFNATGALMKLESLLLENGDAGRAPRAAQSAA
jgi:polysaccharide biosynthesis protein PslH